jgi:hypothetical protein
LKSANSDDGRFQSASQNSKGLEISERFSGCADATRPANVQHGYGAATGGGQLRWLALLVGLLFACGGRASGGTQEAAEAGATGTGAAGSSDAPGTVTLLGSSGEAEATAITGLGPCFVGFTTFVGGMDIDFMAFVQEPGDYQGDPIHILFLSARLPDGRTFSASTNSEPYGEIDLHAVAVSPRFSGAVNAKIYDRDDPSAPPLALSLTFDVKGSSGCGE